MKEDLNAIALRAERYTDEGIWPDRLYYRYLGHDEYLFMCNRMQTFDFWMLAILSEQKP